MTNSIQQQQKHVAFSSNSDFKKKTRKKQRRKRRRERGRAEQLIKVYLYACEITKQILLSAISGNGIFLSNHTVTAFLGSRKCQTALINILVSSYPLFSSSYAHFPVLSFCFVSFLCTAFSLYPPLLCYSFAVAFSWFSCVSNIQQQKLYNLNIDATLDDWQS